MKRYVLAAMLLSFGVAAAAQVHVNGYTKRDGTVVAPYERTAPNSTRTDNYSTQGNTNPYTGQAGTKSPYDVSGSTSNSGYNPYTPNSGYKPKL